MRILERLHSKTAMKNIINSALKKNIIANFSNIGIQLINQILLVPLFLFYWNINLYSDWIVITAISSLFGMSDIGLNSVTANQFTISYAEKDIKKCISLITNDYILILFVTIIAILCSIIYIFSINIVNNLGLHALNRMEGNYVFLALILQIFIGMGTSVIDSIYRANSLNHKSVYLNNMARLAETIVIAVCVIFHISIIIMVTFYLLPKLILGIYKIYDTNTLFNYKFRLHDFDFPLLKSIFIPSITFMSFSIGNVIVFQGYTLLLNKNLGAEPVVLFNTTRTMCNFMKQILSTMQQAVWPEYSIAYGKHDRQRMKKLHHTAFSIATIGGVIICIGLLLWGPIIYKIWTHGKISFNYSLMIAFLVILLLENAWTTSSVCLLAINKHIKLGLSYVITAAISIAIAAVISQYKSLPMIEFCLLVIHIPLTYYTIKQALILTNDTLSNLLSSLEPHEFIRNIKNSFNNN